MVSVVNYGLVRNPAGTKGVLSGRGAIQLVKVPIHILFGYKRHSKDRLNIDKKSNNVLELKKKDIHSQQQTQFIDCPTKTSDLRRHWLLFLQLLLLDGSKC